MEVYRIEKGVDDWLFKAYDYVRTDAFCCGQGIPIEFEFAHDDPQEELQAVVLIEDHKPVAGCRIAYPKEGTGKIERVCVVREKQKAGYGSILINEAEKWIAESGVKHIVISSQDRAAEFYHKVGYVTNPDVKPDAYDNPKKRRSHTEETKKKENRKSLGFTCVLVEKYL